MPPRYPPFVVKSIEIRKNPLLRMRVQLYTKIDLKIEFSGSKNPLRTLRIAIKALKRVKILSCVCACSHILKLTSETSSATRKTT